MKKFKKLASIVIAASMVTSSLAFTVTANATSNSSEKHVAEVADSPSQASAQGSVILHAFNWSYKTIQENLPDIAAAGYTAIQTSPVQQPKDYYPSRDIAGQWWKLYQPVSMSIAKQTWLGTKEELTSMCAEADKYGIKIICDIVSNHMGNETENNPNSLSTQVQTYAPEFYNNQSTYFHSETGETNDNSIVNVVHGHVSKCPDLNTSNKDVQNAVVGLLKECIDCGVDGFRFDAAKHIETPDDGNYASDYWPTITEEAGSYYNQKTGGKLFIYGEILNTCGNGRSYSSYTKYISVTDSSTSDRLRSSVKSGNASAAANPSYTAGINAENAVLWAESHDTFWGTAGSTSGIEDSVIVKIWAIAAARKDASALYFTRSKSSLMGDAADVTTYKSTAVSEINKFHNEFAGQDEKLGSSDGVTYVARGTNGIVLSNCKGNEKDVSISDTGMADGEYIDTISGNKFTVASGVLTGSIGSTGVAVVYNGTTTPKNTCSVENGSFNGETITVTIGLENATSGTYALDNSTPVSYTGQITIRIGSDYNYGDTINLTLTATDGTKETKATYKYVKNQSASSGVYVFYDPSLRSKTWKEPYNVYIYDEKSTSGTTYTNAAWPGEPMQFDEASGYWYYEVSSNKCISGEKEVEFDLAHSMNTRVIFNEGGGKQYPAQDKEGKALEGKTHIFANPKSTSWEVTDLVPSAGPVQDATDVTRDGSLVPNTTEVPTSGSTAEETTVATTPTDNKTSVLLGDADGSGIIDVKDATQIQKHIANIITLSGESILAADVDGNGKIDVDDVTYIQKYLAKYDVSYKIGQVVQL